MSRCYRSVINNLSSLCSPVRYMAHGSSLNFKMYSIRRTLSSKRKIFKSFSSKDVSEYSISNKRHGSQQLRVIRFEIHGANNVDGKTVEAMEA